MVLNWSLSEYTYSEALLMLVIPDPTTDPGKSLSQFQVLISAQIVDKVITCALTAYRVCCEI